MKIAISAFSNQENLTAFFIIDCSNSLHLDLEDFISNHKSDEFMSFKTDDVYLITGTYHYLRKKVSYSDILKNQYTNKVTDFNYSKKQPESIKIYANRFLCYFYAEKDGVVYQSHDMTVDIIKEWCKELVVV